MDTQALEAMALLDLCKHLIASTRAEIRLMSNFNNIKSNRGGRNMPRTLGSFTRPIDPCATPMRQRDLDTKAILAYEQG